MAVFCSVPIRRTRWPSFWMALAAQVLSLLLAAGLVSLLWLSSIRPSGSVVIIVFGSLWLSTFFLSFPWQRRCARSLDLRGPRIRLANAVLAVPVTDDFTLEFKLDEPHELKFGWFETVVATSAAPTIHTRTVVTYATLSQAAHHVFLKAEDSVREAQNARWSKAAGFTSTTPVVRLWATDLVTLVEAVRVGTTGAVITGRSSDTLNS